jgi:iron complex outermembrane recepter protein
VSSVYANNANTMWVPSYTIFDAHMKYRVSKNVELSARLRNLTDEVYASFIHQRNTQYYLGEPRSLEVALNLRF